MSIVFRTPTSAATARSAACWSTPDRAYASVLTALDGSARPRMAPASSARSAAYGHSGAAALEPDDVAAPPRVPANAASAPVASSLRSAARRPRQALSAVAPASTGPATPNESREASGAEYPSARAAASVAPVRDTPGTSAAACANAERERSGPRPTAPRASGQPRPSRVRVAAARRGRRSAAASASGAEQQPGRQPRGPAEALLDRPLEQRSPATTGGASDSASVRASGRSRHSDGRQREQRAGVQRDLELLAALRRPRRDLPAQQPRHGRDVRGGARPAAARPRPGSTRARRPGRAQADDASAAGASPRRRR